MWAAIHVSALCARAGGSVDGSCNAVVRLLAFDQCALELLWPEVCAHEAAIVY